MIDFEPALIASISPREDHLSIVFPEQVMYGASKEDRPSSFPLMLCELQLSGGTPNPALPEFPLAVDNIRVAYKGGERRFFLPEDFREEGPVRVYAEIGTSLLLLAEGSAVSLKIISQVGTIPVTYVSSSEE